MKGKLISVIHSDRGESIEEKIRKARTQGVSMDNVAPMIYTAKKDGVRPEYDIRTDRQEVALDAINKYQGTEAFKTMEATDEPETDTAENADAPKTE